MKTIWYIIIIMKQQNKQWLNNNITNEINIGTHLILQCKFKKS